MKHSSNIVFEVRYNLKNLHISEIIQLNSFDYNNINNLINSVRYLRFIEEKTQLRSFVAQSTETQREILTTVERF